eukprot:4562234-Ditylum_brightwellii.AAC.1
MEMDLERIKLIGRDQSGRETRAQQKLQWRWPWNQRRKPEMEQCIGLVGRQYHACDSCNAAIVFCVTGSDECIKE